MCAFFLLMSFDTRSEWHSDVCQISFIIALCRLTNDEGERQKRLQAPQQPHVIPGLSSKGCADDSQMPVSGYENDRI